MGLSETQRDLRSATKLGGGRSSLQSAIDLSKGQSRRFAKCIKTKMLERIAGCNKTKVIIDSGRFSITIKLKCSVRFVGGDAIKLGGDYGDL